MSITIRHDKTLSKTAVIMLTIGTIAGPTGIVIMAQYGMQSIFYYALAIFAFFIPSAFIFAELGSSFSASGGIYTWVKEAFGTKAGNISIWSQWMSIVFSFPLVVSFALSFFIYPFYPALAKNGHVILIGSIIVMCLAIYLAITGIKFIEKLSFLCAFGVLFIPVIAVVVIAIAYLATGHISQTHLSFQHILPTSFHLDTFSLIGATIFMFAGLELTANCIHNMKDPQKSYPQAIFWSCVLISIFCVCGTLAITILIPTSNTSIVRGLVQAFVSGADILHLPWLPKVMGVFIGIGFLVMVTLYLFSSSKGLQHAAREGLLPSAFAKESHKGIPVALTIALGIIGLAGSIFFVISPTVHAAFWLIEAVVVVISCIRYLLVFPAAIVLRYKQPQRKRLIKAPGGLLGMWIIAGVASLMVLFGMIVTFIPPAQFTIGNHFFYDLILVLGTIISLSIPLLIDYYLKRRRMAQV